MKPSASNRKLVAGFSPEMLIDDVRTQAPELAWLPEALACCGPGTWNSAYYVHYVSPANPNQPGSDWQFKDSVAIEHSEFGTAVIDILHGDRIGRIELVDQIPD